MSVFKDTPDYIKATVAGTISNYLAASLLIHSDDATVCGNEVENGQTLDFSTEKNTGLNDLSYNPGTGHIHITLIR